MRLYSAKCLLAASLMAGAMMFPDGDGGSKQEPPLQRGVALGLYSEDPAWSYLGMLKEIKKVGASHVSIVVPWYVKTTKDTEIFKHPRFTAPMSTVLRTIREARALGLEIFLFPILRVEDMSDGGWQGTLEPRDKDAFYKSYNQFILLFARLAEEQKIPLLSIGSELASLDIDSASWRNIIANVRSVYGGKLTYSANWDHYTEVPFFDALDYLGVTGYFELAKDKADPSVEDLIHSWRNFYFQLMRWQSKMARPLVLTEVGYLSQAGSAAWPWKEGADEPLDLEIQRRCYEAFRRVWNKEQRLLGVYFWNWFGWGGKTSKEYTPRNKPALNEISKWYLGR